MNTVDTHSFFLEQSQIMLKEWIPMVHGPGDWYYMPPNTPMSAANNDEFVDAELIDIFIVPPGQPEITIIEPGWPASDADGVSDDQ
jgi:hypothetical protein